MLVQSTMRSPKRLGQMPQSELNFKVILKVTKVDIKSIGLSYETGILHNKKLNFKIKREQTEI